MVTSILTALCGVLFAYVIVLRNQARNLRTDCISLQKTVDDMLDSYLNPQAILCRSGRHVWVKQTIVPQPSLCIGYNERYSLSPTVYIRADGYDGLKATGCDIECSKNGRGRTVASKIHLKRCQYCEAITPSAVDRIALKEFDPELYQTTQQAINSQAVASVHLST